jgi:hypothetical protein
MAAALRALPVIQSSAIMRLRAFALAGLAAGLCLAQKVGRPPEEASWAPKPVELTKYVPPHKPVTRLVELKKKHAGEPNWREVIVDDSTLHGE